MLATWGTSTGFNPASLFAGGIQGAWYDPSDNTTMFQDSTGTTPVTAVEQAVGLILDKSKGLVLGPELVTNGGPFVNTTGWTGQNSATLSVASGQLRISGNGTTAFPFASTPFTTVVGRGYFINANVAFVSGVHDSVYIQKSDAAATVVNGVASATGPATSKTLFFIATATTTFLQLVSDDATDVYDWNNISVRELAGNHAFQSTSASRPTLRARYNLLTYSEQIDNSYWTKSNGTITSNAAVAPDGTTTADLFVPNTASASHLINNPLAVLTVNNAQCTFSIYAKSSGYNFIRVQLSSVGSNPLAFFDVANGTVGTIVNNSGTVVSTAITSVGNGWYRCSVTALPNAGTAFQQVYVLNCAADNTPTFAGNGTSGVFLWGAQLVPTAVFPSNVYQRIGASTDYATGPQFPQYLAFDGTDDSLLTSSVDFATVTSDGQARRNLLNNPTQFDVTASWTPNSTPTITANAGVAPDGTLTADQISGVSNGSGVYQAVTVTNGATYSFSAYLKYVSGGTNAWIGSDFNPTTANITINTQTGAIVSQGAAVTDASVTSVGNGWYLARGRYVSTGTVNTMVVYSGAAGNTFLVWGAQLETGSTATAFQNIGTDQMTVYGGVTKLSDASTQIISELGNRNITQAGSFTIDVPATNRYRAILEGTAAASYSPDPYASPITNVVSVSYDIGGAALVDEITPRINGVVNRGGPSGTNAGTGNFGNYPLYIGRRNNASLPFNGRIYSLIVRGAQSNSTQIAQTERYVASKTPLGVVP